ncbi:MAG TPA: hypothetical protein VGB68_18980 [Pyrinomonadaceae bacterium]|jgi:hypothetical protein
MTDKEISEFNSAVRMIDFNAANAAAFAGNAKMTGGFAALASEVEVLESAGANRVSARGIRTDGTLDKNAAKTDLLALLRKIAETAKTIKKDEPAFENTFKLPRGTLGSQQLLDTASSFAAMLTAPLIARFGEFGLASATPANLNDKIAAFQTARAQQNAGKSVGVASTAETKASIKRLMQARRTTAQIGENILEDSGDAGLLEAWRSACRIERHKTKPAENPPPQPPTP